MPDLDSQTRSLILGYLDENVPLDDLRRRFMGIAWGLDDARTINENPLTARVSLYLAEYGRDHRTVDELQRLLSDAVATISITVSYPEFLAAVRSTSATGTTRLTRLAPYLSLVEAGT
jgi:hypothetical protein